jgi:hypothetical protein
VKIQIMGGKFCLRCIGKTLLGVVNKLCQLFEFLLKVKVMGSNPGYLLKSLIDQMSSWQKLGLIDLHKAQSTYMHIL